MGKRPSFAMARCPNRQLKAKISALFKNEVHEPGAAPTTRIKGAVVSPITLHECRHTFATPMIAT
jgi:hypothetical protein